MNDAAPAPTPVPAASALRRSLPQRFKAAGIHMILSAVVFAVALYLILVRWYPGFHFGVDGGWQGVRIMAAVDLVLGPMLTLVIFNPFKARRLIAFDLTCIGLAQLGALAWGFYAVHGQRPLSINYYAGIFYSMPAQALRVEPEAAGLLRRLSDRSPAVIYVAMPQNETERKRAAERADRKLLAHEDAFFFRAVAPHWAEIQQWAVDPAHMQDPQLAADLAAFLQSRGGQAADYRLFRYQGGYGSCILAFNAAGDPLDALACEAQ